MSDIAQKVTFSRREWAFALLAYLAGKTADCISPTYSAVCLP